MRARVGLGLGVIAALAVAIWAAVAQGGDETPSTTTTLPPSTTSAPPTTISTTTVAPTSTTTTPTTTPAETTATTVDAEARAEEVRLILQDLYFRWFDAIYRNDEEAVRAIAATQNNLKDFHRAVEQLRFPRAPTPDDIRVSDVEILRWDESCLVVYSVLDVSSWRGEGAVTDGVNVLLPVNDQWLFGTAWVNKHDLWQDDCGIEPDLH